MAGPRKDGTLPTGLITSGRVAVSAAASGDAAAPAAPVVMGAPVGAALLPPGMLPLAVPGIDLGSLVGVGVGVSPLSHPHALAGVSLTNGLPLPMPAAVPLATGLSSALPAGAASLPGPHAAQGTLAQLQALQVAMLPQPAALGLPFAVTGTSSLPAMLPELAALQGAAHRPHVMGVAAGAPNSGMDASARALGSVARGLAGMAVPRESTGHVGLPSSDDTTSGGTGSGRGSEEASSSDGSDSGDKKCRSWKIMLTAQQAVQIYQQMPTDSQRITSSSVQVGMRFGVSAKTVRDIWKRQTWVKATRQVWSAEDERQYQEKEERKHADNKRETMGAHAPPGSVASLLADEEEFSPWPSPKQTSGHCRTRGRPKGVKDSRPRKRRNVAPAVGTMLEGLESSQVPQEVPAHSRDMPVSMATKSSHSSATGSRSPSG